MVTLNIKLPRPMKEFIESEAEKSGYESVGEYIQSLVIAAEQRQKRQVEDLLGWSGLSERQKRKARLRIEALLQDSLDSGSATPMTKRDWDDVRRDGLKRLASRKKSRPQ